MERITHNNVRPKLQPLRISTNYSSMSNQEDPTTESDDLPTEKGTTNQLVRRTVDLGSLYLVKSNILSGQGSPMTPFGPKTTPRLIPAKKFDGAEIELDVLENYHI